MSVGEIVLKYSSRCIPVIVVFAGLAMVTAGCSDLRMAANNAAANSGESLGERTGYGTRSDGYSTDVATEFKGSLQRAPRPQTAASGPAPVQQGQPATSAGGGGQAGVTDSKSPLPARASSSNQPAHRLWIRLPPPTASPATDPPPTSLPGYLDPGITNNRRSAPTPDLAGRPGVAPRALRWLAIQRMAAMRCPPRLYARGQTR